jgi:hypothetical protein
MSVTEILEALPALSTEERAQVKALLDTLPSSTQQAEYRTREREAAWVDEHRDEYMGRWVAVEGDTMVAHGDDARAVYKAAREAGIDIPYVVHVKQREEAFMGG